jgi:hypothetical protein
VNGRIDKLRRDIAEAITAKDQRIAELEAKLDEYELLHRCDCCDCLTEDAVDMGDNMQCPSCSALWKATARAQAAEAALEGVRERDLRLIEKWRGRMRHKRGNMTLTDEAMDAALRIAADELAAELKP